MDFLEALFGAKPSRLYILLWTPKKKRSWWFRDVGEARAHVRNCMATDCYVGVGLSPRDYGPKNRCPATEIAGIVGLWADLDIIHPCHSKANLPPDEGAALSIIDGLPAPTLIVHTGHGLQPWWLFREPWIFDDAAERQQAAEMSRRWQDTLRARARRQGWDVDSTADLARLLRVPGTTNTKADPVEVRLWT